MFIYFHHKIHHFNLSISTVFPNPPSLISAFRILLEQIILSSLSAQITVGFEKLVSRVILLPEICIAQGNIRYSQVLNGILDQDNSRLAIRYLIGLPWVFLNFIFK